jgi:hypothetical protein
MNITPLRGLGMDKLSITQGVALGYKYYAPPGPIKCLSVRACNIYNLSGAG